MFILLGLVLFLVLPSPWSWVALVLCPIAGAIEIAVVWRTVRGRRAKVGAQTLIGRQAEVATACRPLGQVRLGREIWNARCARGADPGELVTIVGREGLVLTVEPVPAAGADRSDAGPA